VSAGESPDSAAFGAEDPVALDVAEDEVGEAADDPDAETEGDSSPACDVSSPATSLAAVARAGDVGLPPAAADGADAAGSAPDRAPSDPEEDLVRESASDSVPDEFLPCTPSCVPKNHLQ
jgi:hypothetical protein